MVATYVRHMLQNQEDSSWRSSPTNWYSTKLFKWTSSSGITILSSYSLPSFPLQCDDFLTFSIYMRHMELTTISMAIGLCQRTCLLIGRSRKRIYIKLDEAEYSGSRHNPSRGPDINPWLYRYGPTVPRSFTVCVLIYRMNCHETTPTQND